MSNNHYGSVILVLSCILILKTTLLVSNGQAEALDINGIQFKEGKKIC